MCSVVSSTVRSGRLILSVVLSEPFDSVFDVNKSCFGVKKDPSDCLSLCLCDRRPVCPSGCFSATTQPPR